MQEHHLKTYPECFQVAIDGLKLFELRKNDRDFQIGDLLILEEWQPPKYFSEMGGDGPGQQTQGFYTGRRATFSVKYIFQGGKWGLDHAYVIMAIQFQGLEIDNNDLFEEYVRMVHGDQNKTLCIHIGYLKTVLNMALQIPELVRTAETLRRQSDDLDSDIHYPYAKRLDKQVEDITEHICRALKGSIRV